MVRVNLLNPKKLSDQHLIAEYNEILMLVSYIKKFPQKKDIPKKYCLGKGHMKFFKNKTDYLKKRHESLRLEMKKRNFQTNKEIKNKFIKSISWKPNTEDLNLIKKRIISKIKKKPKYYRYFGKYKPANFFIKLLNEN